MRRISSCRVRAAAGVENVFAAGVAAGLAYGLQLAAYGQLMVAFVELAKRVVGAVGSVVFGRLLLREPLARGKLVGIAILCVGIALIVVA